MNYTIINFTRLGDLLQTQSTIAALKKASKDNRVSLICLEQFASAAKFIKELDDVHVFPSAHILHMLHTDWRISMDVLNTWINDYYKAFPYDTILNLTPSMNCRAFAQLLTRKNKSIILEGFALDSSGFGKNTSVWTSYVEAVTKERGCSPYNLIDGFRSMLNLEPEPFSLEIPKSEQKTNSLLKKKFQEHENLCYIGFQLGASDAVRQWDLENFAQLAHFLWTEGLDIENAPNNLAKQGKTRCISVLFGAPVEKELAEKFSKHLYELDKDIPFINLCGETSLDELGTNLCEVTALVSNDTGTLHLAVGLGTAVLGIYLATAQVWDTGPYGLGHLCLEPRLDCHPCAFNHVCEFDNKCRKSISAQSAYEALQILVSNNVSELKSDEWTEADENIYKGAHDARLWQSYFDADGFVSYHSLSGDERSDRTLWIKGQKLFYKNLLSRFTCAKNKEETQSNAYKDAPLLPIKGNAFFANNIDFIERLLSQVLLLKEQSSMLILRPSVKAQENFFASIERINSYFKQNNSFTPLFLLWKSLIQEHANDMDSLVQFFDTLHQELIEFKEFLASSQ